METPLSNQFDDHQSSPDDDALKPLEIAPLMESSRKSEQPLLASHLENEFLSAIIERSSQTKSFDTERFHHITGLIPSRLCQKIFANDCSPDHTHPEIIGASKTIINNLNQDPFKTLSVLTSTASYIRIPKIQKDLVTIIVDGRNKLLQLAKEVRATPIQAQQFAAIARLQAEHDDVPSAISSCEKAVQYYQASQQQEKSEQIKTTRYKIFELAQHTNLADYFYQLAEDDVALRCLEDCQRLASDLSKTPMPLDQELHFGKTWIRYVQLNGLIVGSPNWASELSAAYNSVITRGEQDLTLFPKGSAQRAEHLSELGKSYKSYITHLLKTDDLNSALKASERAELILEESGDLLGLATIHGRLGHGYRKIGYHKEAFDFHERAAQFCQDALPNLSGLLKLRFSIHAAIQQAHAAQSAAVMRKRQRSWDRKTDTASQKAIEKISAAIPMCIDDYQKNLLGVSLGIRYEDLAVLASDRQDWSLQRNMSKLAVQFLSGTEDCTSIPREMRATAAFHLAWSIHLYETSQFKGNTDRISVETHLRMASLFEKVGTIGTNVSRIRSASRLAQKSLNLGARKLYESGEPEKAINVLSHAISLALKDKEYAGAGFSLTYLADYYDSCDQPELSQRYRRSAAKILEMAAMAKTHHPAERKLLRTALGQIATASRTLENKLDSWREAGICWEEGNRIFRRLEDL